MQQNFHYLEQQEEYISPPYPDDLVTTSGNVVQCLPHPAVGAIAAVMLICHLSLLTLKRAEQVLQNSCRGIATRIINCLKLHTRSVKQKLKFLPPV